MLEVGLVVKDCSCDSSTVLWRRRVVSSNNNLNLRKNSGGSLLVGTDKVEASSTLTIESHSFGKGLSTHELDALIDEKSQTVGIFVKATTGEALVCRVEEWVELAFLANICNSLPLLWSWVDTSWVVRADVEEYSRSWLSRV